MGLKSRRIFLLVRLVVAVAIAATFSSCFKEDTAVVLPPPGDVKVSQVTMGPDYHRQEYFDFVTEDTLGSNHDVWDLCFESGKEGWHIWINGGNLAMVANMDTQDFDAITDTTGAHWKWDDSSWNPDSTGVGDWRDVRMVYIIDLGYEKSAATRFKKIIFQSVSDEFYEIQFANLDGSEQYVKDIPKNELFAYSYFTFENGGEVLDIEPDKQRWDILFTRYRYVFYDQQPVLQYLVTGVLINPEIAVAVDSSMAFGDISYQDVLGLNYSGARDVIGYDWKYYDFDNAAYVVRPGINYIIRDMEGIYWKMHFIDFYNAIGEKGSPQFEFQRL